MSDDVDCVDDVEALRLHVKSLQEQIAGLMDSRAHLLQKNQVLERNLKRVAEGRDAYRIHVEQLNDRIRGLCVEIDHLKSGGSHNQLIEELAMLRLTKDDLANKNEAQEMQLARNGKSLSDSFERIEALKSGIEDQKKGLIEIQKNRDELRVKLMRSTHELEDMADDLSNEQYYRTLFQWLFGSITVAWIVSYFVFLNR